MNHVTEDANRAKLKVLMSLFGLSVTQVARAGGMSRPYTSRFISGDLTPSPHFFRQLEIGLGKLIEARTGQVFQVEPTQVEPGDLTAAGITG